MKNSIEGFKNYLVFDKKSSQNTIESYMRDINQFASYCISVSINNPTMIDTKLLNDYLAYLSVLGKSEATVTRMLASVRCFFKFLLSRGIVNSNPCDMIKFKGSTKKLPGVLDAGEIIKLLSQPSNEDFKGIRDKAMLELLYATGIKVSELLDLTVSDFNMQIGILHLHNKSKERIIPMYPAAVKSVTDYLINVRPIIVEDKNEDRLFTNMNGQAMTRQGFWKIIKHYADMAGIKSEITPHTLRHSFAAHLLENGANLKDIKEMLGHSDISSTQIYAQFMKNKYTSNYAKFHPLAKK